MTTEAATLSSMPAIVEYLVGTAEMDQQPLKKVLGVTSSHLNGGDMGEKAMVYQWLHYAQHTIKPSLSNTASIVKVFH